MNRVTYKSYAGIHCTGTIPVSIKAFQTNIHLHRAAYLATLLEAPQWGSVQSYDGAGISAGPFHWIAVYPSTMKQGPLFEILAQIRDALGVRNQDKNGAPQPEKNPQWKMMAEAFTKIGWYLTQDGILRDKLTRVVSGEAIRNAFAPSNGLVPQSGPNRVTAEIWAQLFHSLFSDPETYAAQINCSIEYLVAGQKKTELGVYRAITSANLQDISQISISGSAGLKLDLDLAMSVYHAHSVNAPGIAIKCLTACSPTDPKFSAKLIRSLATTEYGNWDKRYVRTRKAAQESGLWPSEMFVGPNAIMPVKF